MRVECGVEWKRSHELAPGGHRRIAMAAGALELGFEISAKFFVSAQYREKIFRYFRKISF